MKPFFFDSVVHSIYVSFPHIYVIGKIMYNMVFNVCNFEEMWTKQERDLNNSVR